MHRVRAVRDIKEDKFVSPHCRDELRSMGDNLGTTMSRMRVEKKQMI